MFWPQSIPVAAMIAIIAATVLRGIAIRRRTGDRPLAFLEARGIQRIAGLSFAASTAALIVASGMAAWDGRPECNCVRQVLPRKFRVRDCTQATSGLQGAAHRALTGPAPRPSMPRNPSGAPVADATPSFLPRGGGRF